MTMVSLSSYVNDQLERLSNIQINSKDDIVLRLEIERSKVLSDLVKSGVAAAKAHLEAAQYIDSINPTDKNSKPSQDVLGVLGFE